MGVVEGGTDIVGYLCEAELWEEIILLTLFFSWEDRKGKRRIVMCWEI